MFPALFPISLPSLEQRREAATSLLDPSGKGVHNGFRVPDQAMVWTGESLPAVEGKKLLALFAEDNALVSVFWFVPVSSLEASLSLLHRAAQQAEGMSAEKGLVGVWEALGCEDSQDVMVGWVGSKKGQAALEAALVDVGFEESAGAARRIVFEENNPSPLGGRTLLSGEAMTDDQDGLLWSTMSSKTEGSLYGGGYLLEMLPLLLIMMLVVIAAFVVFSGVGNGIHE